MARASDGKLERVWNEITVTKSRAMRRHISGWHNAGQIIQPTTQG